MTQKQLIWGGAIVAGAALIWWLTKDKKEESKSNASGRELHSNASNAQVEYVCVGTNPRTGKCSKWAYSEGEKAKYGV